MELSTQLNRPGEHKGFLEGRVGQLESILNIPDVIKDNRIAVIGHPHSLKGGTMHNKVVTTLMRVFRDLGIPSVRFNFRGVGESGALFDAGIGESDDMLHVVQQIKAAKPEAKFIFAGFSFGSFVAYRAAAQHAHELLITVAPPVNHFDFSAFEVDPSPWVLAQGDMDEVIPPSLVFEFAKSRDIEVIEFKATGHFFHGKLMQLRDELSLKLARM